MEEFYKELVANYSEPHRHYHTLEHIQDCFEVLERSKRFIRLKNEPIVKAAIFYHDIVYDPAQTDNEEASAEVADEKIPWFFETDKKLVRDYIIATKDHVPIDDDSAYFLDIDMSGLGKPTEEYFLYSEKIKQEYLPVIQQQMDTKQAERFYQQERKKFLQSILDREPIFTTKYFQFKFEKQARQNMQMELERYSS